MSQIGPAPSVAVPAPVDISVQRLQEPARPSGPEPDQLDTTEMVIQIIMEATGYERDEVEPDMDLREDLSIRSSRLPVIMDSVESHFGIKVDLEDFMDVRTIRDISDRISTIIARQAKKEAPKKGKTAAPSPSATQPGPEPVRAEERQTIKRLIFREVPLEPEPFSLLN